MGLLPQLVSKHNVKDFVNRFDNILTDCDGVTWLNQDVIPGANVALNRLRSMGKGVFFLTNNSTKSRETLKKKCQDLGFTVGPNEAVTSSYITAQYLKSLKFSKKVFVVGSPGISAELEAACIPYIRPEALPVPENVFDLAGSDLDPDVGAVVVGFDPHFNVAKIALAASYLADPGCLFIATNNDPQFPLGKRGVFPGTGSMLSAVETAAGRKATVTGKPDEKMFTVLQQINTLDPKRTLMIGDRANTDILFGKNCGLRTLVTLTGVTTMEMLHQWSSSSEEEDRRLLADYYIESLGDIADLL